MTISQLLAKGETETHLVGCDLVEVEGGQGSEDKHNNKDAERPNPSLKLLWSADPNFLREPLQANMTKQHVHLLPQLLNLLKTKGGELVLKKTFVNLFGFLFKVDNCSLQLLQ